MKAKLVKTISYALAAFGIVAAHAASVGCIIFVIDEPEMPASMLEE